MKLSIIFSVLNLYKIFVSDLNLAIRNLTLAHEVEILIIDNNSDEGGQSLKDCLNTIGIDWTALKKCAELKILTNRENCGNYPIFEQGWKGSTGEILCFLHSDMLVHEKGWDERVINEFAKDEKLGLIGFIGSNEIDYFGGRGFGTMSNFMDMTVDGWRGSPAEVHGRRITDLQPAAVVDGCSMIFRRKCLYNIGFIEDFPPHHFYDRLMCCQAMEKGWRVAVLGIQTDHLSGRTANGEAKWHLQAEKWAKAHGYDSFDDWFNKNQGWIMRTTHQNTGRKPDNWDALIYLEAEKKFLIEWRDQKHFIPLQVKSDYTLVKL